LPAPPAVGDVGFSGGINMKAKSKIDRIKQTFDEIEKPLKSLRAKAFLHVRRTSPLTDEGVVEVIVVGSALPLYVTCLKCFGHRTTDGRDCPRCNGDGFMPIDFADAATLVDRISNTLEPLLKKRATAAVDVLADAHQKLVDVILDR
jgi:hypothetical protein